MQRPCITCGRLASKSYCSQHDPRKARYKAQRGSGGRAATFRKRTLAKSGGRCAIRGCATPFDKVEAHHTVPVARGGSAATEGMALCAAHHRQVHHGRT